MNPKNPWKADLEVACIVHNQLNSYTDSENHCVTSSHLKKQQRHLFGLFYGSRMSILGLLPCKNDEYSKRTHEIKYFYKF